MAHGVLRAGTGWREWRLRATRHPSMPCAPPLRRPWACASRAREGAAFFRSTLVQTLFYGVFSAWVLWARQTPPPAGPFNWHDLRMAPESARPARPLPAAVLALTASAPGTGRAAGLDGGGLDRVDRAAFFDRFDAGEAVPYFYEPFLEAFDPELRKQLGVWYTPAEVVRYMVARVDMALKEDLGIADGLAADNVYVLDPCCGTGTYLAEVLRRIAANLQGRGLGRPHRSAGEAGGHPKGVRVRDHACALRRVASTGGTDHAGAGRPPVR